jgi:hypothetical protein
LTALLSIVAIIGGCGLICLQCWIRRWQTAYLVLVFILFLAITITEVTRGHAVGYIALFAAISTLPYLPFLWMSPSACDESRQGCGSG